MTSKLSFMFKSAPRSACSKSVVCALKMLEFILWHNWSLNFEQSGVSNVFCLRSFETGYLWGSMRVDLQHRVVAIFVDLVIWWVNLDTFKLQILSQNYLCEPQEFKSRSEMIIISFRFRIDYSFPMFFWTHVWGGSETRLRPPSFLWIWHFIPTHE